MTKETTIDASTAARLLATWHALRGDKLKVAPQFREVAEELMAAPLTMTGLVDTRHLSEKAMTFGRMAGMAFQVMTRQEPEPRSSQVFSATEVQTELFRLFAELFAALTGSAVALVADDQDIKNRMMRRAENEPDTMADAVDKTSTELSAFYGAHAVRLFEHTKTYGGMRLVSGGQRAFGPSALNAVRLTGLYADTQFIPDPIYPFFTGNLSLNAAPLQLAIGLFYILQLRPLIDAELPVPPIFLFPSFEQPLEEYDAKTKYGIEQLAVRLVAPICEGTVTSLDEIFEYANRRGESFAQALAASGLFIPPGIQPDQRLSVEDLVKSYISSLEGVRSAAILDTMKKMPSGVLLLTGVLERLRPHFHLLENATELNAQPLLSQHSHWYYFEKCAQANAEELHRQKVLSEQAFHTLRAVQDDSLSWLATISVQTLTELIANDEHRWLRDELNKYTAQLAGHGNVDTNDMVREVNYGLASLVQRQQKAMNEIERKYAPKKMAALFGGGAGVVVGASVLLLPYLGPLIGASAPIAAALGGGLMGFGKEKVGEVVEKRQAKRSMLGVLATVRPS